VDFLSEYIKAWSRHGIHFGVSCEVGRLQRGSARFPTVLSPLNILDPNPALPANVTPTLSVHDECLFYRFPHRYRNRELRGQLNVRFLNPASLPRVLDGVSERPIILLSIPQIYTTEGLAFDLFLEHVDRFLSALPKLRRYAMELHNPNYLLPDYFECLRKHGVGHVVHDAVVFTTDFGLMRDLESFADIDLAVRRALNEKKRLYIYFEEDRSLKGLMELLNDELRRLSLIKRTQAA